MKLKSKKKEFKFTFGIFVRLLIFTLLIIFGIQFLSSSIKNKKTSVLGEKITQSNTPINLDPIYNLLPPDSQKQVESFKLSSSSAFFQEKINWIKKESEGFPQKQITEIQKLVVTKIYDNIINSIEKK